MKVTYQRENRMVRVYRHRDKQSGLTVCDFTDVWFKENITDKPCFYCSSTENVGADRIDNNKGHTKDNIVPCCKKCNLIRNQFFTHQDFKKIVEFCIKEGIAPFSSERTNLWCNLL